VAALIALAVLVTGVNLVEQATGGRESR